MAGPASRQLQGVCMDLAMAAQLVVNCRNKFVEMRSNNQLTGLVATWTKIITEAKSFARMHGITDVSIVERTKLKRRMAGENATDESRSGEERLKVAMFIPVLDQLIVQLQERFSDEQVGLMKEMSLFSSGALKSGSTISPSDIPHLTQTYHLDSDAIAAEYPDFCTAFGSLNLIEICESYHIQIVNDQPVDTAISVIDEETVEAEQSTADVDHGDDGGSRVEETETRDDDDDNNHDELNLVTDVDNKKWILQNFIIPLKVCYQLSGYPHLLRLYWILCTLPASSCSAERALSRLRIIKNRLRSTMCDEWTKALMVLASEKDILRTLTNDEIIDNYAVLSDRLQKQLLFF